MSEDHRDRTRARKPLVIVVAAALVTLASLFSAASASASVRGIDGIADARYCELFEMTGALPDAKVVVWNTIGLNDCPERKWEAIDTAALAEERGSTLIIKNGPRHFLMDAASARTGRVDTLGGIEMRKVATIPVSSPADLNRSPYTERTIGRTNDWKWKKGRKVFELLAPNGANYLMQSYSQEIDPSQSIDDLDKLGKKLALPQGWEYRVRKLKKPLVLEAKGEATILQDDLRNTYQRLPAKKGDKREKHKLDLAGITKLEGFGPGGSLIDRGTVTGKPFGAGTIEIVVTLEPSDSTRDRDLHDRRGRAARSTGPRR